MSAYRRKFKPPLKDKDLRPLLIIAVEGDVTEIEYFQDWNQRIDTVNASIELIPPKGKTDPKHIFDNLVLNQSKRVGPTEYWMVIDRDQWPLKTMEFIVQECKSKDFHFCVSNPSFEFWLLLHFERGDCIKHAETDVANTASSDCAKRLRSERYLGGFHKSFKRGQLDVLFSKWKTAVNNARALDTPKCKDFPKNKTGSTVYKLVEHLTSFLPLTKEEEKTIP